jgi:hypothetical protein
MKKEHTNVEIIQVGDHVNCDVCNEYFPPGDPRCGGFLFGSKAYCPDCAEKSYPQIIKYREEKHIKAWCPAGMTFHDWCMKLRGGDNTIKIITKEMK